MRLINQNDYPDMEYKTNAQDKQSDSYINGTIARSGCGLCSLAMMIERLTLKELPLEEAVQLSYQYHANEKPGTSLKILAPVIAEKFDLDYEPCDDEDQLNKWLAEGGMAIVNTGGDREGFTNDFCHSGHYMLINGCLNGYYRILDPNYKAGQYGKRVNDVDGILYVGYSVLEDNTENRRPRYYLFNTKGVVKMKDVMIATGNKNKVREYKEMLEPLGYKVHDLSEIEHTDPEETGTTFQENAVIKAMAVYKKVNMITIADDSGISIAALNGAPGVYSARYLNTNDYNYKNAYIIKQLENAEDRHACTVAPLP